MDTPSAPCILLPFPPLATCNAKLQFSICSSLCWLRANHNQAKALGDLLVLLAFSIFVNENLADWQTRPGPVPGGTSPPHLHLLLPVFSGLRLTLATLINVIGHMQIFGALAGLLLGITDGPRKTALQGILALVAKLLLSSTGIICKEQER